MTGEQFLKVRDKDNNKIYDTNDSWELVIPITQAKSNNPQQIGVWVGRRIKGIKLPLERPINFEVLRGDKNDR